MRSIGVGLAVLLALTSGAVAAAQEPSAKLEDPAGWTAVASPVVAGLDALEQVVATGSELVAIGSRCDAEGACERVVLASHDGSTWGMRGSLPDEIDLVADLVADGGGLYVAGDDAGGAAAIWRSADAGSTWQTVGAPEIFAPDADGRPLRGAIAGPYDISTLAITRGPAGLVAGGWLNGEALDRSAIWRSEDGMAWERVRLPRGMDRAGGVLDVAATGNGYVAATAEGPWRSDDGVHWTAGVTEDGPVGLITEVEPTEAGFIGLAIGTDVTNVWAAGPDGSDWRREPDDPALVGVWEAELRALGPRVVAVGTRDGDERIPTAWSLQGLSWTAETITTTPGAIPADVAVVGDDLVVVGTAPAGDGTPSGAAWRRSVSPPGGS